MTQNNLGAALQTLGARESGTARLEEAVAAYRAALKERTQERVPLQWAMTQMNLGNALSSLGEREIGTARLEEAVSAYREALKEYTQDRVRSNGRERRTISARRFGASASARAARRVLRRRSRPIAKRSRKGRKSACGSNGR
jgi:tetratricopeptide (TPR) repeat protein